MAIASRSDHRSLRLAVALPVLLFLAYGIWSTPGLVARWDVPPVALLGLVLWIPLAAGPLLLARRAPIAVTACVMAAIAIGLRIAAAVLVGVRTPPGDAHYYLVLAHNLMAGRGFVVFEPFMGVETRALFPPLYPMLLALWGWAGGLSIASVTAFGAVIDLATAAAIVAFAEALGNRRAGIAAAWLYIVWPPVLMSAPLAQKEGLCALLALVLALQWMPYASGGAVTWRRAAGIGLSAGLLTLAQPGEAPLAALFGLVAMSRGGVRPVLRTGLMALPFAILPVMLPWWMRNAAVFGTFVPLTSAGGYGLWEGNNPDADGHWMPPPAQLRGLPEIAFGKAAGQLAIDWITRHPEAFARTTLAKAVRAWGIAEFGASRLKDMAVPAAITATLFAMSQATHLLLLGATIVGARVRRTPGAMLLLLFVLACVLQTLVFGVWFEFGERHRDFATPFLLLFAMFGLRGETPVSPRQPGPPAGEAAGG